MSPAKIVELDKKLRELSDKGYGLPYLDGMLAALLSCPQLIQPTEIIGFIIGEEGGKTPLKDEADGRRFFDLFFEYYNSVAEGLADGSYKPLVHMVKRRSECDHYDGKEWSAGYMSWTNYYEERFGIERDNEVAEMIWPLGLLTEPPEFEHNLLNSFKWDEARLKGFTREIIDELHETVIAVYHLYDSGKASEGETDLLGDDSFDGFEKVGRNEPCPCGSGKKYKKCCGG